MVTASAIFFKCLRCGNLSCQPPQATRCSYIPCGGKIVPLAGPVMDEDVMVPWSQAWCERAAMIAAFRDS